MAPRFRCLFLLGMSSSSTPWSSSAAFTQFLCRRHRPSPFPDGFSTPKYPTIRFKWAMDFGALPVHIATTCRVARLPWRIRPALPRPTEAFTPGLPSGWSPFPMPGMTTVATGQSPPTGIAPAGTFRGYLQRQFVAWTRSAPIGVFLSAALFGAGHIYQGAKATVVIGAYGLMFGILAEARQNLRPGIITHAWHYAITGLVIRFLPK